MGVRCEVVALSFIQRNRDAAEQGLEPLLTTWPREDPENRPVFRLSLSEPWPERQGI